MSSYGSVYDNPKTGESIIVYKAMHGNRWIAETNSYDAERKTKREIMKQVKAWGFTKYVGQESLEC